MDRLKRGEGREGSATPAAVVAAAAAAAASGPQNNNVLLSAVINAEQDLMVNKSEHLNSNGNLL